MVFAVVKLVLQHGTRYSKFCKGCVAVIGVCAVSMLKYALPIGARPDQAADGEAGGWRDNRVRRRTERRVTRYFSPARRGGHWCHLGAWRAYICRVRTRAAVSRTGHGAMTGQCPPHSYTKHAHISSGTVCRRRSPLLQSTIESSQSC